MTDMLIGVAVGVSVVAVQSFLYGFISAWMKDKKQMISEELLHIDAAKYATNRKKAYVEAMNRGAVDHMSEEELNNKWLAHYEGYREGYWAATGDSKFSTDPAKLKEKS